MHYLYKALISAIKKKDRKNIPILFELIKKENIELEFSLLHYAFELTMRYFEKDTETFDLVLSLATDAMLLGTNNNDQTLLHIAVKNNNPQLFKVVMAAARRVGNEENFINHSDTFGRTVLHVACGNDTSDTIFKLLVQYKADPELHDNSGKLPKDYIRAENKERYLQLMPMGGPGDLLFQYQVLERDRNNIRELINDFKKYEEEIKHSIEQGNNSTPNIQKILYLICAMGALKELYEYNISRMALLILAGGASAFGRYIYKCVFPDMVDKTEYQHLATKVRQSDFYSMEVDDDLMMPQHSIHTYIPLLETSLPKAVLLRDIKKITTNLSEIRDTLTSTGKPFLLFKRQSHPTEPKPDLHLRKKNKI